MKINKEGKIMAKHRKNEDGMRYPSVDKLLDKVDSKYKLAYLAAKRAKIIEQENGYTAEDVDVICDKPVGQALEEVLADKVSISFKPAETIFNENIQDSKNEEE